MRHYTEVKYLWNVVTPTGLGFSDTTFASSVAALRLSLMTAFGKGAHITIEAVRA